MPAPSLPPPPFPHRFSPPSPTGHVARTSPPPPLHAAPAVWPEEPPASLPSPVLSTTSSRRSSNQPTPSELTARQSSSEHLQQQRRWTLRTERELYLDLLEQRLHEAKSRPRPPGRRDSGGSHLASLAFAQGDDSGEDGEDASDGTDDDDDADEGDTEDDSAPESERPLIRSPGTSRRPSGDAPGVPVSGGPSTHISFAPVVRIAAGIRSLAGSYSPYSRAQSRSSSPASSIYAPLLAAPGIAPGAALKQAARYGTTLPPSQILGRQQPSASADVAPPNSSPYKALAQAQRAKKRKRRRKRTFAKFRRRVAGWLCCSCCCSGREAG